MTEPNTAITDALTTTPLGSANVDTSIGDGAHSVLQWTADLGKTAIALVFVLLLAWAALRLIKRFQQGGRGSINAQHQLLVVTHSLPVGAGQKLVIARYRECEYILGITNESIRVINALPIVSPSTDTAPPTQ